MFAVENDATRCPVSGTRGRKMANLTLKALLASDALRRLDGKAYRYCPDPGCAVVYFDRSASSIFEKGDLIVTVGEKEHLDSSPVCYCFDITRGDIRRDLVRHGKTGIPGAIRAELQAGHCACEVRNPQGSCCLGNVAAAIESFARELESAKPPGTENERQKLVK